MKTQIKEKDVFVRIRTHVRGFMSDNETVGGDDDEIMLATDGRLRQRGSLLELLYKEDPESEMGDTLSTLIIDRDNPGIVNLTRSGDNNVGMVFNADAGRQYCAYVIDGMTFEFCVLTDKIFCDLTYEEGGSLSLDYAIEIHGVSAERISLRIDVTDAK